MQFLYSLMKTDDRVKYSSDRNDLWEWLQQIKNFISIHNLRHQAGLTDRRMHGTFEGVLYRTNDPQL